MTNVQSEKSGSDGMPQDPSNMGSRLKRSQQVLKIVHTVSNPAVT